MDIQPPPLLQGQKKRYQDDPSPIRQMTQTTEPLQGAGALPQRPQTAAAPLTLSEVDQQDIFLDDFEFYEKLGSGSYGQVYRTKYKRTDEIFAIKTLDREFVIKNHKMKNINREKDILFSLNHENVVKLIYTLRDEKSLYFVYEYVSNGTLSKMFKKFEKQRLPLELAVYYTAELITTMEYLHGKGIIHRDLKPQNILITSDYHLKICDFGDALKLQKGVQFTTDPNSQGIFPQKGTFCGTPLYVSPEMLEKSMSSIGSDLWALGVIVYQMVCGDFPFKESQEWQTFQQIINVQYTFPEDFDPIAKDLVQNLLQKEPLKRLGAGAPGSGRDYKGLKKHPFFDNIDWKNLRNIRPPLKSRSVVHKAPLGQGLQKPPTTERKQYNQQYGAAAENRSPIKLRFDSLEEEKVGAKENQNKQAQLRVPSANTRPVSSQVQKASPMIPLRKEMTNPSMQTQAQAAFALVKQESSPQTQPLSEQIQQIKELKRGQLRKKNRFFMQQLRTFVLTSEPRLKYYKNDSDFRGEIPLTSDVEAVLSTDGAFKLCTSRKTFVIKGSANGDAEEWVQAINDAVKRYSKNLNV